MLISSPHNQRISLIRNLSGAKARRRTGLYFIEGIGLVARAVAAKSPLETLVVCERLCQSDFGRKLLDDAHAAGLPRLDVSADLFITLAEDRSHGVAAIARQQWSLLGEVNVTPEHSWIALDAIQYPPNLGMILRTADAAGYTGIILLDNSTDPYSSAAVRASRGAVFSQSLVRATLADFADWKRSHPDIHLVGTSPAATTDYRQAPYIPPMVLLMGCERNGLSPAHQALCDELVRIPMAGQCDSLNVAVAAALMLYEAKRHRDWPAVHPAQEKTATCKGT